MKRLAPSMTQPSPSRTARVRMAAASEPASASVRAKAMSVRPAARSGNQRSLLLIRTGQQERQRTERLHREDESRRRADAADRLDRQADRQEVATDPAVFDRERQAEHVVRGEELLDVPRERGRPVDLRGSGGDPLVGQQPHGVAEPELVLGQPVAEPRGLPGIPGCGADGRLVAEAARARPAC